jgi:hypothetical protein
MSGDIGTAPMKREVEQWYESAANRALERLKVRFAAAGVGNDKLPTPGELRGYCEAALGQRGCFGLLSVANPGSRIIGERAADIYWREADIFGLAEERPPSG